MTIEKALKFATLKHKNQKRKRSKVDYIHHPIIVSFILLNYLNKDCSIKLQLQIIAILHDVLEDTNTSYNEIIKNFNIEIANGILDLTNDKHMLISLGKNEYLKHKLLILEDELLLIKLSDRLHNVLDNPTLIYILDTMELMDFLKHMRTDLPRYIYKITIDIEKVCRKFIEDTDKKLYN